MSHDRIATFASHPRDTGRQRFPDRWLAARLQRLLATVGVRVQLWDGRSSWASSRRPIGTLMIGDRPTLLGLVVNPELWFGEAYTAGRLQIQGDLEPVLEALYRLSAPIPSAWDRLRAHLARAITVSSARRNAHRHYDLGNEFYKLWLDDQMVYTCAYFPEAASSLEEAQRHKLDLVCRKLRLRPGERVLETGSGWGALALHMARHHGVTVTAYNVSHEQVVYARDRAVCEGLADRVEFIEDDYRSVRGRFDAFVSVGMLEHVGRRQFRDLSDVLRRTIRRDGGRGLLHFIGRDTPRPLNAWIRRRIFPGAYPPTLTEVTKEILTPSGMSVLDVENLRLHYARTLAHWSERFRAVAEHVRDTHGDEFRRTWEIRSISSLWAWQNTGTGWSGLTRLGSVTTAVRASAAWRNASAFVGPIPMTPISASCEKCAHDDVESAISVLTARPVTCSLVCVAVVMSANALQRVHHVSVFVTRGQHDVVEREDPDQRAVRVDNRKTPNATVRHRR